jgi:hypothetical protein
MNSNLIECMKIPNVNYIRDLRVSAIHVEANGNDTKFKNL